MLSDALQKVKLNVGHDTKQKGGFEREAKGRDINAIIREWVKPTYIKSAKDIWYQSITPCRNDKCVDGIRKWQDGKYRMCNDCQGTGWDITPCVQCDHMFPTCKNLRCGRFKLYTDGLNHTKNHVYPGTQHAEAIWFWRQANMI